MSQAGGQNPPPNPGPYPARKVKLKKGDTKKGPTPAANVETMCHRRGDLSGCEVAYCLFERHSSQESRTESSNVGRLASKKSSVARVAHCNLLDIEGNGALDQAAIGKRLSETVLSRKARKVKGERNRMFPFSYRTDTGTGVEARRVQVVGEEARSPAVPFNSSSESLPPVSVLSNFFVRACRGDNSGLFAV